MEVDDDVPPDMDTAMDIEEEDNDDFTLSTNQLGNTEATSQRSVATHVDPLDAFMANIHTQVDTPVTGKQRGVFGSLSKSNDSPKRQKNPADVGKNVGSKNASARISNKGKQSKRKGEAITGRACFLCAEQKPKMKRCSRCKQAYYCSQRCQKLHYRTHRRVCRAVGAEGQLKDQLAALSVVEKCKDQGYALLEKGRVGEALKLWETGIQSCAPYTAKNIAKPAANKARKLTADLHEMRAQIFMTVGKDFEAVKEAEMASLQGPNLSYVHLTLGRARLNFGEVDLGLKACKRAQTLDPHDPEIKAEVQRALELQRQQRKLEPHQRYKRATVVDDLDAFVTESEESDEDGLEPMSEESEEPPVAPPLPPSDSDEDDLAAAAERFAASKATPSLAHAGQKAAAAAAAHSTLGVPGFGLGMKQKHVPRRQKIRFKMRARAPQSSVATPTATPTAAAASAAQPSEELQRQHDMLKGLMTRIKVAKAADKKSKAAAKPVRAHWGDLES